MLHDITDVLRVGDVTLIDAKLDRFHTFEVKTRLTNESPHPDGGFVREYTMDLLGSIHGEHEKLFERKPSGDLERTSSEAPSVGSESDRPRRHAMSARVRRQLERLDEAVATRLDPQKARIERKSPPVMHVPRSESDEDWDVVRRVTRRARRSGLGYETVGGWMLVVAFYDQDRFENVDSHELFEPLAGALSETDLLKPEDSLQILSIPPDESRLAQTFRPFYLYPLPRATVLDLMWRRMGISLLCSWRSLAMMLEQEGVVVVESGASDSPFWDFGIQLDTPDGDRFEVQQVGTMLHEIAMEMRSPLELIDVARLGADKFIEQFGEVTPT